jgi:hypothetical protein
MWRICGNRVLGRELGLKRADLIGGFMKPHDRYILPLHFSAYAHFQFRINMWQYESGR